MKPQVKLPGGDIGEISEGYTHGIIWGRVFWEEASEMANKFPKEQVCPAPKNKTDSVFQCREEGERGQNEGRLCELPT